MSIDLAGLCTGDGECSPTPLGLKKNWVTTAGKGTASGGLPLYIRAVANSLRASGHSESDSISLAIGIVRRWAQGEGKVTPATRARAAKALAEWEALKAKSHDHTAPVTAALDLATAARDADSGQFTQIGARSMAPTKLANLLPDRAAVIAFAKKVETWPPMRRDPMKKAIAVRAKQLGMQPDGDGDYDGDVPSKVPGGMGYVAPAKTVNMSAAVDQAKIDLAVGMAARKAAQKAGATLGGSMKYPTTNEDQFKAAIRMVGLARGTSAATVKAYLIRRAKKMGWTADLPDGWLK
jgi:hypothetical protein